MEHRILKSIGFIAGLLLAIWLFSSASADNSTISYWVITVRGTYMDVWVDCNGVVTTVEHLDGMTQPGGWNKHSVDVDLSGCDYLAIGFTSEFPQNSLGWKIKGIAIDGVVVPNGCFENGGLLGWELPDVGWSLSVAGGNKNIVPEDCEGRYAAKHGPISTNGAGTANVPATIYIELGDLQITPIPTVTNEPTTQPTNTPQPTATNTGCFYNHCSFVPIAEK